MYRVKGKYNAANIFIDNPEKSIISQIKNLCDQPFSYGSKIRIMPDAHVGAGCTIGTTMTINNAIVPNLVGVDIGCGVLTVELGNVHIDLKKLDKFIRKRIPNGHKDHNKLKFDYTNEISKLNCFKSLSKSSKKFSKAIGSLGGGNHFIEIDVDSNDKLYLLIHSGSRNLGFQVAQYYQNKAFSVYKNLKSDFKRDINYLINENAPKNIIEKVKNDYNNNYETPKNLCYLTDQLKDNYLEDMAIIQKFASINRKEIAKEIIKNFLSLNYKELKSFETVHNYIDMENMILRKGAVSSLKKEKLLIPLNMRDGSLICVGKGNSDWNFSAPHGAGRLMSRRKAKSSLSMKEFKNSMEKIYTTSVNKSTLDEAPMAYKNYKLIMQSIKTTVKILKHIKPIYNFKSS
ncbi:MAG: RtcB family protein [Bacillota bacterium]